MRITAVETFPVRLPLRTPMKMSHITIAHSDNVIVKVSTDEGLAGWGEGVPAMDITGDDQARIVAGVEALAPRLVGTDPLARTEAWLRLQRSVHGNGTAIGALDIALHDLAGKALGVPVVELLGGTTRTAIPALTLMGSGDPDADLAEFERRHDAGYRWFKLKLGVGDPDSEVKTFTSLASAAGDDVVLCGDANAGWSEQTSRRFLRSIDGLGIRFIEQPTADSRALVRLAETSPVAICADEGARSMADIVSFGPTAVAGVSLKLIKLGGITGVMRAAALCDALGLRINLAGKVAESAIAAAANVHCAAAMSDAFYGCSPANQGLAEDVTSTPYTVVDGAYPVPAAPGLGIEVDEDRLRHLAA